MIHVQIVHNNIQERQTHQLPLNIQLHALLLTKNTYLLASWLYVGLGGGVCVDRLVGWLAVSLVGWLLGMYTAYIDWLAGRFLKLVNTYTGWVLAVCWVC